MPGFWSPIELSIPLSVSAMRGGGFPSRGSGVTVFVTNASRLRATSGAVSASRHPDALRIGITRRPSGPGPRRTDERTDRRARRRSRSTRRTRTPSAPPTRAGRAGTSARTASSIGSGPHARTSYGSSGSSSVTSLGSTTTVAPGSSDAASAWWSLRNPRIAGGSPSASARYGIGAIPIPPATSSGRSTSRSKPFPSGPRTRMRSPVRECAQRTRPRADRVDEERELTGRRLAQAHRPREHASGCLEHEELAGNARLEIAALEAQQRVRPDRLGADDGQSLAAASRPARSRASPGTSARFRCAPGAKARTRRARSRLRAPRQPRPRSSSRTARARRAPPRG